MTAGSEQDNATLEHWLANQIGNEQTECMWSAASGDLRPGRLLVFSLAIRKIILINKQNLVIDIKR